MSRGNSGDSVLDLTAVTSGLYDLVVVQSVIHFRDLVLDLVRALEENRGEEHRRCASQLCKQSRAIRFQLGLPEDSPTDAVEEIARLFSLAADSIDRQSKDPDLGVYRRNISKRAQLMLDRIRETAVLPESQSILGAEEADID